MGKKIRTFDKKQIVLPADLKPDYRNQLVRIGSKYDGGYVLAASLLGQIEEIITYGLGFNWDFEKEMLKINPNLRIDCYDHTIGLNILRREFIKSIVFYFNKTEKRKGRIEAYKNYKNFFSDSRVNHYKLMVATKDQFDQVSVDGSLARLGSTGNNILLKCDIEGSEYEIIDGIIKNLERFIGIAIEFHHLDNCLDKFMGIIRRLREDFYLDHIHVNNLSKYDANGIPSVVEVSLSRRGILEIPGLFNPEITRLPTAANGNLLDAPNSTDRPDIEITYK